MVLKRVLAIVTIVLVFGGIFLVKSKNKSSSVSAQLINLLKDGDLIFQTSTSNQGLAIQLATKSPYSHCGIIYKEKGNFYVFEAAGIVESTLLNEWIARGKNGKFVVKRLKEDKKLLTPANLIKLKQESRKMLGKTYDLTFEWSDGQMYCSELIWKIYKHALNIEIAPLAKLKTFDLSNPIVKEVTAKRYGKNIPLEEPVISPKAIFDSKMLTTVISNP